MRRIPITAAAVVAALLLVPSDASSRAAVAACPQVLAHRGAPTAPENTVPAIERAGTTGADMVELDVQWSNSSYPILMHDATVDRTTDGTGTPAGMTLTQLRALWAADYAPWSTDPQYASTPVPYGWEYMSAASTADLDVLLDIHATPTELGMEKLAYYIDAFSWRARTVVMGSPTQVAAMRVWQPDLRYAVIEYNPHSGGITQQIRTGESVQSLGAQVYVVPARDVTVDAVAYWQSYGLAVWTWTSDSPALDVSETWSRVTAAGVSGIITNHPADLVAQQAGGC